MENSRIELRPKQRQIFEFICSFISDNKIPPTVREIAAAVNLRSSSTVHMHLKELVRKGYITMASNKQRAISVIDESYLYSVDNNTGIMDNNKGKAAKAQPVPLLGDVAAGQPILALDSINDVLMLPTELLRGAATNEAFLLTVKGDSMIDIGMYEGDLIVVNAGLSYNDGDIVVACVEGETATVKRIYREKTHVRLQPENSSMDPIIVNYERIEIVGKVVGLIRKY